ncbi:acid-sensing ion channel 4-B-like [Convolutriloba macropyga]|uniref:acid-sensing ion channel 4-B-like n=1 Tax=Convolutriloba macropyga TaxID=536237 RepID=UPI003F5250E9
MQIVKMCNCTTLLFHDISDDADFKEKSQQKCDFWRRHKTCVEMVKREFNSRVDMCGCTQACRERILQKSVSSTSWPTGKYAPYFASVMQRLPTVNLNTFLVQAISSGGESELRSTIALNTARVEIRFESLSYTEIKEEPKYNYAILFGTVGGNMGLWVGWSIMTMFEIFQWIYFCTKILLRRN